MLDLGVCIPASPPHRREAGAVAAVSYGSLDVKSHFHMPMALHIKHTL